MPERQCKSWDRLSKTVGYPEQEVTSSQWGFQAWGRCPRTECQALGMLKGWKDALGAPQDEQRLRGEVMSVSLGESETPGV